MQSTLQKIRSRLFRKSSSNSLRSTTAESYALISKLGFKPKTVIDVGVASGTEELYSAFPEATLLLIEALNQFEPNLVSILKRYRGSYLIVAAGPKQER
jgi:hypothetical protein